METKIFRTKGKERNSGTHTKFRIHVQYVSEMRNAYRILVEKPEF